VRKEVKVSSINTFPINQYIPNRDWARVHARIVKLRAVAKIVRASAAVGFKVNKFEPLPVTKG
jgi:hypothetical protein